LPRREWARRVPVADGDAKGKKNFWVLSGKRGKIGGTCGRTSCELKQKKAEEIDACRGSGSEEAVARTLAREEKQRSEIGWVIGGSETEFLLGRKERRKKGPSRVGLCRTRSDEIKASAVEPLCNRQAYGRGESLAYGGKRQNLGGRKEGETRRDRTRLYS